MFTYFFLLTLSISDFTKVFFSSCLPPPPPPPPPPPQSDVLCVGPRRCEDQELSRAAHRTTSRMASRKATAPATSGTPQSGERYHPPTFPTEGWSSKKADFPRVSAGTIIFHLMKTGKSVQCRKKSGDGSSDLAKYDVQLVQKPLSRALDFVFDYYIHDEHIASVEG